jgi:hypothetical protein
LLSSSHCRAPHEAARLSALRAAQRHVCRAAVDEQQGQASTRSMDSSPASTPRCGGRPQGVGRATPEQPKSRRRPLSSVSTSTPSAASGRPLGPTSPPRALPCPHAPRRPTNPSRRPPGGTPHWRPTRPVHTTVEEPSGELLSSHCPQNLGATSLSCPRRCPRPPHRRSWPDLAEASPARHGERAPLLRPWTGRQRELGLTPDLAGPFGWARPKPTTSGGPTCTV